MAAIIGIVTSILADAPAAVLCLVFEEIRFQLLPLDMLEAILHLSRGGAETKFLCCAVDHLISHCRYVNNRLREHTRRRPESTGIRWLISYQLPFISTSPIVVSHWICVIVVIFIFVSLKYTYVYVYSYIYVITHILIYLCDPIISTRISL